MEVSESQGGCGARSALLSNPHPQQGKSFHLPIKPNIPYIFEQFPGRQYSKEDGDTINLLKGTVQRDGSGRN